MTTPGSGHRDDWPAGAGPVELVEAALIGLRVAQDTLDPGDGLTAATLKTVAAELDLLSEEISVQYAEIEAAQQARLDERELVRRLLADLPVPMVTSDAFGAINSANTAVEELLATTPGILYRKPLLTFVHPQDRRTVRGALREALDAPDRVEITVRLTPRHGEVRPCRITLARSIPAGRPVEVHWVFEPVPAGPAGTSPADPGTAYSATLVDLTRLRASGTDLRGVLRRVCELATDGLDGVGSASVVLGDPAAPGVVASSSAQAQAVDGLQHVAGQGPAFDAYAGGRPVATRDAGRDGPWPALARLTGTAPVVTAWVSVPLLLEDGAVGVLTLYGDDTRPLEDDVAPRAEVYAAAAQALIGDRRALEQVTAVRDQLSSALSSRAVIDQAKGMIMLSRGCGPEEAFALLVRMSNLSDRKVRDLAAQFVAEAQVGLDQLEEVSPARSSRSGHRWVDPAPRPAR